MSNYRFQAFKKAIDGTQDIWEIVTGLSLVQARDEKSFPLGKQKDRDGREYIWAYSVAECK